MHVAIIMDGNGRWAERRGLRREAGHRAGARAVRCSVEAAVRSGIEVLTLYAFSSDNWARPAAEVNGLMHLFKQYLQSETARCYEQGVRINVIGRRDRLSIGLHNAVLRAERTTADCSGMTLRIAVDYSARDAILRAAGGDVGTRDPLGRLEFTPAAGADDPGGFGPMTPQQFASRIARAMHSCIDASAVDLLIRTGGEQRLSDFLLWECAYAELVFLEVLWPDFDESSLQGALEEYHRRERRYGGIVEPSAARLAGTG